MTTPEDHAGPTPWVGGRQPDVAPARNLLADAGVRLPNGEPPSEALVFGLAGGIGFLYGCFEYRTETGTEPTLTIVPRNDSLPDPFLAPLFSRVGVTATVDETGGARTAARRLDAYLTAGRSVLLSVGEGHLPYLGLPVGEAAMAPRVVRAIGFGGVSEGGPSGVGSSADGASVGGSAETDAAVAPVLVDDRAPTPHVVPREALDAARAAHRKSRHRLVAVTPTEGPHDWATVVVDAALAGAVGYDTPPVPAFAANVGTAGLRRFRALLIDTRNSKGWPRVFGEGKRAAIGLTRLYDCVTYDYTAPAASRPLYADFLEEAVALSGREELAKPVEVLREAGRRWARVAELAAAVDDVTRRYAELSDRRAALLAAGGDADAARAAVAEQHELVAGCTLDAATATAAYGDLAVVVGEIADLEQEAVAALAVLRPR